MQYGIPALRRVVEIFRLVMAEIRAWSHRTGSWEDVDSFGKAHSASHNALYDAWMAPKAPRCLITSSHCSNNSPISVKSW
ncbi:hypothetical protein PGT21_020016 [Puccinia graminis f. sp. tritici]|uniref:Uncharacterized protein n=1 Tax=Puccinia graminis f. sp. tritici TaxID=56615 RepID=A0A5B0Q3X5_PUCGR|nr:hypothetical protein PGT21_020016 [Puccinia graminis f. sp. tritici]